MGSLRSFLRHNFKIIAGVNWLIALVIVGALPLVVGLRLIDAAGVMRIFEMYLSLLGIIILGGIMNYSHGAVMEILRSRKCDIAKTFSVRVVLATLMILLCMTVSALFAGAYGSEFPFFKVVYGGSVSAITLGVVCLTVYSISRNMMIAYMVSLSYYIMEIYSVGKYTKSFFLLSMIRGDVSNKWKLLFIDLVLIIVNMIIIRRDSRI